LCLLNFVALFRFFRFLIFQMIIFHSANQSVILVSSLEGKDML
jgi:hypothetical protein